MIRVAVAGALGRMGRVAYAMLHTAPNERETPALTYAGGFARRRVAGEHIVDDLDELFREHSPDVVLDLTTHPTTLDVAHRALRYGVRPVIGATGWSADEREALRKAVDASGLGAMLIANFSIGAALMMRLSETASRFYPTAEIVEYHHDGKKDAPSGTACLTAERLTVARDGSPVPVHSVRLRGLVAHQEVLFGGEGEVLTIRHDALSRESFVPGMRAAVRAVMHTRGLVVGMDALLDEIG